MEINSYFRFIEDNALTETCFRRKVSHIPDNKANMH